MQVGALSHPAKAGNNLRLPKVDVQRKMISSTSGAETLSLYLLTTSDPSLDYCYFCLDFHDFLSVRATTELTTEYVQIA